MKRVTVGTAGHIDHGKTALVKALTGIDADRLKEEKRRGITIDIGFADLSLGDVQFGFVDVPGHERFVKNMLAGAHGIDLVMLVVAADESVMPQTREHFDICRLLQIPSGIIALTKIDTVEPEFLDLVESELGEFVKGSFLERAPVVRVSSKTAEGIESLKRELLEAGRAARTRSEDAVPRLPIDRAFSIKGFGTVVTGTLVSGAVRVGDELEILPGGVKTKVRGLQVHGHDTREARAGERTAVNLQNVTLEQVRRGLTLVPAGLCSASSLLDAGLELLPSAARALKKRARVRLHLGTAEVMARVLLLERSELPPGDRALVQLRLESPVLAFPADRFIVRSYSPQVTIGGGAVLDSMPFKHKSGDTRAVEVLAQLRTAAAGDRVLILLRRAGERGIALQALAARCGMAPSSIEASLDCLVGSGDVARCSGSQTFVSREALDRLQQRAVEALRNFHEKEPLKAGLPRETLLELLGLRQAADVGRHVIELLVAESEIRTEKELIALTSHSIAVSSEVAAEISRFESVVERAGLQALEFEEAAENSGLSERRARELLQLLLNDRRIIKVSTFLFHARAMERLKALLRAKKTASPRIDVSAFKNLTGTSRKHAIPLLEYLDGERITRREGNLRVIL